MSIERGLMVMKGGDGWGVLSVDPFTRYGWVGVETAILYPDKSLSVPSDASYAGSGDAFELNTGRVVLVERRTSIVVIAVNAVNADGSA